MATEGEPLENGSDQILDPGLSVDDDEYVRRRRLKSINDTRDRVHNVLPEARLEQLQGNLTERDRAAIFTESVQAFLSQAEPTILKLDGAAELMENETVGEWEIDPPNYNHVELLDADGLSNCSIDTNTLTVTAHGLDSIIESSAEFTCYWSVIEERYLQGNRSTQTATHGAFPEHVARSAFRMAVRFLDDAGINFQPHLDSDEYEGKYAHLVELDE